MPAPTIIVRYNDTSAQWEAWFDGAACVTYGDDFSMIAVHRLLDGSDTDACDLTLHVDRDQVGSGVLIYEVVWQPPDLVFRCERCHGTGECLVFPDIEKCQRCKGRG